METEQQFLGGSTIVPVFEIATFLNIRKTCPCNVYPLELHFYIAKLGYAEVLFAPKHILWVFVRIASTRRFLRVPTIYVLGKNNNNIKIFSRNLNFQFLKLKKNKKKKKKTKKKNCILQVFVLRI